MRAGNEEVEAETDVQETQIVIGTFLGETTETVMGGGIAEKATGGEIGQGRQAERESMKAAEDRHASESTLFQAAKLSLHELGRVAARNHFLTTFNRSVYFDGCATCMHIGNHFLYHDSLTDAPCAGTLANIL